LQENFNDTIMEIAKVDKLECRYPFLFKVMWLAIVVWMVVGIANYFGHWLLPEKLDGFGMSVLFLFVGTVICCFGKGFLNLISKHGVLTIDTTTKRITTYTFMLSFMVLLVISIWEICGTMDNHSDFTRNGAVVSIPLESVFSIVYDVMKAAVFSIGIVLFYWYIRIFFLLFTGRIRRIGIEIALALLMMAYLSMYMNDMLMVNLTIVLIAGTFLYDIWRFADFREEKFQMNRIKKLVVED